MTNKKESRIIKCMKAPVRFLIKARDLYIKGMTEISGQFAFDAAMGCPNPTAQLTNFHRSFSVGSTSSNARDDYKELIRAASVRSYGSRFDLDGIRKSPADVAKQSPTTVPRSYSVGMGRIDEDKPCEFGDDIKVKISGVFPRSKSYAVRSSTTRVL